MKYYQLCDPLNAEEREQLKIKPPARPTVMARATGEFRVPLPGEWYLSGAIVEAYRNQGLGDVKFHIARLVKVRRSTQWIEVL